MSRKLFNAEEIRQILAGDFFETVRLISAYSLYALNVCKNIEAAECLDIPEDEEKEIIQDAMSSYVLSMLKDFKIS